MSTLIQLFVTGLFLGLGPCILYCAPILISYIAATTQGWLAGLKATLLFSAARLFAYVVLGLVAGGSGEVAANFIRSEPSKIWTQIISGLFIALLGVVLILGKDITWGFCRVLRKHTLDNTTKGLLLLGLLIGFSPCIPLLGVLILIATQTQKWFIGGLYGFSFGMGTVISPLIVLGSLSGIIPAKLYKNPKIADIATRGCGFILFVVGMQLAVSTSVKTYFP